jgi:hypothetical protein
MKNSLPPPFFFFTHLLYRIYFYPKPLPARVPVALGEAVPEVILPET